MIIKRDTPHQKYYLHDGRIVPGCSHISKIGDDVGGLIHWAWKQGKEGKDHKAQKDEAANIGHVAHAMIQCWLTNEDLDYSDYFSEGSELADKSRMGLYVFKKWWEENEFEFIASELQLVSETYEYGGTLDVLARDKIKRRTLIDIKTTNSLRMSNVRQIAAYENLNNENFQEEIIERRALVRVGKTDARIEPKFLGPTDQYFKTFLAQLEVYNCQKLETQISFKKPWEK